MTGAGELATQKELFHSVPGGRGLTVSVCFDRRRGTSSQQSGGGWEGAWWCLGRERFGIDLPVF